MGLVFTAGNKYAGNPILEGSESYDARGVREPELFKVGDTYYLFYDGCGTAITDVHWTICYATATDLEGAWTKQGRILDVGAGGRLVGTIPGTTPVASNVANYFVLTKFTCRKSGTMDRFVLKCGLSANVKVAIYEDNAGEPGALLGALSTDQAVVIGVNRITFPPVSLTKGTVYWLGHNASLSTVNIYTKAGQRRYKAATYSGFTFPDPAGGSFTTGTTYADITAGYVDAEDCDSECACAPEVLLHNSVFYMFFVASQAADEQDVPIYPYEIGVATASSITGPYTKSGSNPILSPTPTEWDKNGLSTPAVLIDPSDPTRWMMIYTGIGANGLGVGVAYCTLANFPGGSWTKYGGNPIIPAITLSNPGLENIRIFEYEGDYYLIGNYYNASYGGPLSNRVYKADNNTLLSWTYSGEITPLGPTGAWDDYYIGFPGVLWGDKELDVIYGGVGEIGFYGLKLGLSRVPPSFQPSEKDTRIIEQTPTTNYGSETSVVVQTMAGDNSQRSILEFDVSELLGATISSAKLKLYYSSYGGANPSGKTVWAYKLTENGTGARTDWEELQATWNIYKTANSWDTAGGDYVTSNPSGGSVAMPASYGWVEWDIKAIVEDAVDNENYIVELLLRFADEDEADSQAFFYSNEYGVLQDDLSKISLRPRIEVEFSVPIIKPTAIASSEAFGTPTLYQAILPPSIPSTEAFGTCHARVEVEPQDHIGSVGWIDEESAYDENTGTYAYDSVPVAPMFNTHMFNEFLFGDTEVGWTGWLSMNRDLALTSSMARIWYTKEDSDISEPTWEIKRDGAWVEV